MVIFQLLSSPSPRIISALGIIFKDLATQCRLLTDAMYIEGSSNEEDVLVASLAAVTFMNNWWSAYLNTRTYQLGAESPYHGSWHALCEMAADNHTISPHFITCVEDLG